MICAFIVMKCEGFSMITDLVDYLNNNLLIAHYCGFNISQPLPSYWTFDRFLKDFVLTSWNRRCCFLLIKVLLILLSLVLIRHRLLQTLHRIILNPLQQTNLSPITSLEQMRIVNLGYILHPLHFRTSHLWTHNHRKYRRFFCRFGYPCWHSFLFVS